MIRIGEAPPRESLEKVIALVRPKSPDALFYLMRNHGIPREGAVRVMKELVRRGVYGFPPICHMELFLTESCNLGCTYCFVEGKNARNRMSFETARASIDYLFEVSGNVRELAVVFFGGEPTLEFDLIRKIVEYAEPLAAARSKHIRWDITTNGTLLDEERVKFLAEHGCYILLSIDGDEIVHDTFRRTLGNEPTFKRVLESMRLVKRHQRHVGAKLTTMPCFADRLDRSVQALANAGVDYFLVGAASGTPWTVEEAEAYGHALVRIYEWWRGLPRRRRPRFSFLEEVFSETNGDRLRHDYGCRAGRTGITINCRGDIYACAKLLGADGLSGVLPLGTLADGITEVETRMTMAGLTPPDRPGCWGCQDQKSCYGGCYAVNHTTTGDPFTSGPECRLVTAGQAMRREILRAERNGYARVRLDPHVFAPG